MNERINGTFDLINVEPAIVQIPHNLLVCFYDLLTRTRNEATRRSLKTRLAA
jgi:hypothetical protein